MPDVHTYDTHAGFGAIKVRSSKSPGLNAELLRLSDKAQVDDIWNDAAQVDAVKGAPAKVGSIVLPWSRIYTADNNAAVVKVGKPTVVKKVVIGKLASVKAHKRRKRSDPSAR